MQVQGCLQLFGTACWRRPGREFDLPDTLPGYLLAHLALHGDWIGRDALVGLFWPQRSDSEGLHNLRANLHRARALLSAWAVPQTFEAAPHRVRLRLPTDVAEFRRAIGRADWARALDLQGGPLLQSWSFRGFSLLDEWARVERSALADSWRDAALKAALQHELSGRGGLAAQTLLRLLERGDTPTDDAVQALLRVAAGAGCREAALAQYERLRNALQEDLQLQPAAQTQALARALREPGAAPPAPPRPAAAGVPRGVLHPPRLVGRTAERERLRNGALRVVVVAGEPGVGKTRLLEEALPRACWIACREGLAEVPFGAVADWLVDQREALPELGAWRRDLGTLVPALLADEQVPPADPATAKPRLLLALAQLLESCGSVVVFDDLQWADGATCELVGLLGRRAAVPLRLAYRSDELHAGLQALLDTLDAGPGYERIALEPLSAIELLELLATISQADAAPALFGAWLHRRTGGNAFFVLQTLRALFESGRLVAEQGGWASALDQITTDYSELQIPSRAADLVRRRVLALPEGTRRVLTVIAVAGDARAVEPLAAAAECSPWHAANAIAELQAHGLLRGPFFAHDLVRQSVERALPESLRAVLHSGVARHFAGVLRSEQIAAHWWAAGNEAQAVHATVAATATLRQAGLQADALALTTQALQRVRDSAARARLRVVRSRIRLERAEPAEAEADALEALDEVAAPQDRAGAFLVICELRMQQGRLEEAHQALQQAAACDPGHEGLILEQARVAQLMGRVADVVDTLEQRCAQLRQLPPGHELLQVLISLGSAYGELGQGPRGLVLLQEAYRLGGRMNARYAQVEAAINLLWGLSALGRNDEAVAVAEEALALGEYDSTPTLRNNLAWSLRELGRIEQASRLCEQLAAGADPTLAVIAQARLIEMDAGIAERGALAETRVEQLLGAFDSTDIYVAHAAAAKAVLRHGNGAQVERALRYLKPQMPIDPWLHRELSAAMAARGIDPVPHIGEPAGAAL